MKKKLHDTYIPTIEGKVEFYKNIDAAILKRSDAHTKRILKIYKENFEKYQELFNKMIIPSPIYQPEVYQFHIEYMQKKLVWREILILGNSSFEEFQEYIIDSMDFVNDHLHAFFMKSMRGKQINYFYHDFVIAAQDLEDDEFPTYKTDEVHIANIDYSQMPKFGMVFDFGDGHQFMIKYQKKRATLPKEVAEEFPKIIDIRGVAPEQYPFPEDFLDLFDELENFDVVQPQDLETKDKKANI